MGNNQDRYMKFKWQGKREGGKGKSFVGVEGPMNSNGRCEDYRLKYLYLLGRDVTHQTPENAGKAKYRVLPQPSNVICRTEPVSAFSTCFLPSSSD